MTGVRARGEDIRRFILENVEKHPEDISRVAARNFGITRQAANKHLQRLTAEGALLESGKTRARTYRIAPVSKWTGHYTIEPGLEEHRVWQEVKPHLGVLPDNVMNIWHIGFTEIFNNAIEHSEGSEISVDVEKTAVDCRMLILDDGVGIFEKIQKALHLEDPRHAVLELAKGKLTTDPRHHSGEGIFFTSRMFDQFSVHSKGALYSHDYGQPEEWISESREARQGTRVALQLNNHTARTARAVYDEFSSVEGGFMKTVVPVSLAQQGTDQLVSRSQAKRLLARMHRFHVVILDFRNVPTIGQGFADEIFRVFQQAHPEIQIRATDANEDVRRMIGHVLAGGQSPEAALPV
jgi:anti-sigma regulatory factor (Ser/Thr protein kinase)/biotin operon repressor